MTSQLHKELYFFWVFCLACHCVMTIQCLAQFMSETVKIPCTVISNIRSDITIENDQYVKSLGKNIRVVYLLLRSSFVCSEICDHICLVT